MIEFIRQTIDPNLPEGWQWYSIRGVSGVPDTEVKGGTPAPIKSGPRVGEPHWRGRDKTNDRSYRFNYSDYLRWLSTQPAEQGDET